MKKVTVLGIMGFGIGLAGWSWAGFDPLADEATLITTIEDIASPEAP